MWYDAYVDIMHEIKITFIDQKRKPLASPPTELPFSFRLGLSFFRLFSMLVLPSMLCCCLCVSTDIACIYAIVNSMYQWDARDLCLHVKKAAPNENSSK